MAKWNTIRFTEAMSKSFVERLLKNVISLLNSQQMPDSATSNKLKLSIRYTTTAHYQNVAALVRLPNGKSPSRSDGEGNGERPQRAPNQDRGQHECLGRFKHLDRAALHRAEAGDRIPSLAFWVDWSDTLGVPLEKVMAEARKRVGKEAGKPPERKPLS
jgi:hypothetical protein